ncbi:hypothetical protein HY797_03810 [Candidatus Falkowbacteria bacterium]|nr:hypothetical protein [Candidatus Falkowbacteria bacterium]
MKEGKTIQKELKSMIMLVEDERTDNGNLIINVFGDCATIRAQDQKHFLVGIAWLKERGFEKIIGTSMNGHFGALLEIE